MYLFGMESASLCLEVSSVNSIMEWATWEALENVTRAILVPAWRSYRMNFLAALLAHFHKDWWLMELEDSITKTYCVAGSRTTYGKEEK